MRMAGKEYGIGRYAIELVRELLAIDPNNEYVLFGRDPKQLASFGFGSQHNVKLVAADFRHYSIGEQVGFNKLIREAGLDLMHFPNFNVPIMNQVPFVVTIHDVVHHRLPGNKPSHIFHRAAYRAVINAAAKKSELVLTVSHAAEFEISDLLGVPQEKIRVTYEAANPVAVSDSDIVAVKQKFMVTKPYIVFVGVMERKKNVIALARGFDFLKEQFKENVQLVLVGREDPHYPQIISEITRIKYANDVIVTGVVSDKEKYALYKGAVAFASASKFEGFGLPGLEAMAMGTPLAVSDIPVFNEVYDNGAIYFDPNDAIDIAQKLSLLVRDPQYRELIAQNGYARSLEFSWKKTAQKTLAVYQEAVQQVAARRTEAENRKGGRG